MPTEPDLIAQAARDGHHDRPRDAISLICTVLVVYHRHLLGQEKRIRDLERKVAAAERTW